MTEDRTPSRPPADEDGIDVTRRTFLKGAGATIAAVSVTGAAGAVSAAPPTTTAKTNVVGPGKAAVDLTVNGKATQWQIEPWQTLLDTLRDHAGLTGSKRVCDRGSCGGCTVMIDGVAVNSCSYLAIDAAGKSLTTVEGLATGDELTPIQEAFVHCDATQCGFCTPGMIVACTALLEKNPKPTRAEVAEGISGNLCRCGTYQNIFEAVERATGQTKKPKGGKSAKF